MKRGAVVLLLLVMTSFVVAVGSEVSADFNIGDRSNVVAQDYVPSATFWDAYGAYVIGAIIVLIIVIIFVKTGKKKPKKRVGKRKSRK